MEDSFQHLSLANMYRSSGSQLWFSQPSWKLQRCYAIRDLYKRFIPLLQMIEMISKYYGSSTSSWNPWRWIKLDLIVAVRDIYIYIYISCSNGYIYIHIYTDLVAGACKLKIIYYRESPKWSYRVYQSAQE